MRMVTRTERSPGDTEGLTEKTVPWALANFIKSSPVMRPEFALERSRSRIINARCPRFTLAP